MVGTVWAIKAAISILCQTCSVVFSRCYAVVHWRSVKQSGSVPLVLPIVGRDSSPLMVCPQDLFSVIIPSGAVLGGVVYSSLMKQCSSSSKCLLCAKAHGKDQALPFVGRDSSPLMTCPLKLFWVGWFKATTLRKAEAVQNVSHVSRRMARIRLHPCYSYFCT